ncbi:hypothetical protein L208DRAFT_92386 [Tricholoma matsutake]|nr:hypothetical protein L208DRAFT_92386 [Tricholoma matsutake 945]
MDQDSFRRLLQTPHKSNTSGSKPQAKTIDSSQPAFRPRKLKKSTESQYRDRAAERRVGEGNDYAQVEAVLEDFEKRNANNENKAAVESQRRYLGGDSDHTILVKGLDIALLEQNKMRAAGLSTEDDDSLEQAFQDISSQATIPKKRTREDLIRQLKEKRALGEGVDAATATKSAEEEAILLEEAKKKGKFKPIGSKPEDPLEETVKKKKKVKVDARGRERKTKRRKVVEDGVSKDTAINEDAMRESAPTSVAAESSLQPPVSEPAAPEPEPETEPELEPANFDIFAGAGEYEGIDLGDEDEDGEEEAPKQQGEMLKENEEPPPVVIPRRWIGTNEPEPISEKQEPLPSTLKSRSPPPQTEEREEGEEGEQPMRLVPLASSALPSIKDFLAIQGAGGGKRKKRKGGKREGGKSDKEDFKKGTAEAKADRDYKRLKSYTDKKAES